MALFLVALYCVVSTAAPPITITPGSDRHEWRHLSPSPLPHGAPSIPQWSMIYDFDVETNGTGTTDFTNLLWDANLTALGAACARFPTNKAMWSPVASCDPNKTKVYGEPYCGGPTGLWMGPGGKEWQVGADSWVATIKDKHWVIGLWLGDEPEILGVPYAQMCELSLYLKTALIAAGRSDVFIAYNDGPSSGQMANGMCKGLDYFSLDTCECPCRVTPLHASSRHAENTPPRLCRPRRPGGGSRRCQGRTHPLDSEAAQAQPIRATRPRAVCGSWNFLVYGASECAFLLAHFLFGGTLLCVVLWPLACSAPGCETRDAFHRRRRAKTKVALVWPQLGTKRRVRIAAGVRRGPNVTSARAGLLARCRTTGRGRRLNRRFKDLMHGSASPLLSATTTARWSIVLCVPCRLVVCFKFT